MHGFASSVLSCQEREKLVEEFYKVRTRGRNLSRLERLAPFKRAALEQREQAAQTRLRDHEKEHSCQRVASGTTSDKRLAKDVRCRYRGRAASERAQKGIARKCMEW
jgi:hypothetical protein